MAKIKPFKALRPRSTQVEKVATLPYDVFSEQEARDIVRRQPESFLKIVRPETVFPEGTDMYSDEVYAKASEMLREEVANGFMKEEDSECYYIYRQIMSGRSQTGVVACFSVDDYLNNVIKKHEYTTHDKEADRTKHIEVCSAQTGMVFLAYQDKYDLSSIIDGITVRDPLYDFTSKDNVRQTVWKVDDASEIEAITAAFGNMDSLYIADGHHRCASAASVCCRKREENPDFSGNEEFNFTMAVAFPQNQLYIYPYNRVVKDLNGMTGKQFIRALEQTGFVVTRVENGVFQPRKKGEMAMFLGEDWYKVEATHKVIRSDSVGSLDVSMLQDFVLDGLLGIKDPRKDKRVEFVGGIRGMGELERRCRNDMTLAFAMYPTSMDELFRVTDDGLVMPPKSTWFEPKLQSGLFVHTI
ncbi:MAG: DUF1015 domain-containing protein [Parasporobacterium sp.]|nr:DUF1015 domain-containing protein [Parasporobacterium sp.]